METYDGKPTANALLYDLSTIFSVAQATINWKDENDRANYTESVERVFSAINEYYTTEYNDKGVPFHTAFNIEAQLGAELARWSMVCDELRVLGVDINENDKLATLMNAWAEELVMLRLLQTRAKRREMYLAKLEALVPYQPEHDVQIVTNLDVEVPENGPVSINTPVDE